MEGHEIPQRCSQALSVRRSILYQAKPETLVMEVGDEFPQLRGGTIAHVKLLSVSEIARMFYLEIHF